MNGKQLLVQLKSDVQFASIPVIIYSTSKIKQDVEDSLRMGAVAFITKPNKFEYLVEAISHVLTGEWALVNSFS